MKRVVIDCFQLRVKAGNEGQRAALRSRRGEMRDCDGGCGAVPLAAAVERRRRRGPKGKRLACVGPLRTRHKQLLGDWSPATSKTVPVCLATSHKSTHTQCAWASCCTFLNQLWLHNPTQKHCTPPFRSQFVRLCVCCACWEFCEGFVFACCMCAALCARCAWVACAAACCGRPPFEKCGRRRRRRQKPHLASFHPPT